MNHKPISPMELIISLAILLVGWALVFYFEKKALRDKEKKERRPSATIKRLDEFEEEIS